MSERCVFLLAKNNHNSHYSFYRLHALRSISTICAMYQYFMLYLVFRPSGFPWTSYSENQSSNLPLTIYGSVLDIVYNKNTVMAVVIPLGLWVPGCSFATT